MMKINVFTIDESDIRLMNRTARRKAMKTSGGQDMYKPKVQKSRKKYTRKMKHKKGLANG